MNKSVFNLFYLILELIQCVPIGRTRTVILFIKVTLLQRLMRKQFNMLHQQQIEKFDLGGRDHQAINGLLSDRSPVRSWHHTSAETHMGEQQLATILAIKRLTGVASEVNLGERTSCMPLPSANNAAHSGFETQRRHHQKSKDWPIKRTCAHQNFFKKTSLHLFLDLL